MNAALPHKRLDEVSAMAATLADHILMERMTQGTRPVAKAETLWIASLLLEENERPVPMIVSQVLADFRHLEADNDAEPAVEVFSEGHVPLRSRGLLRLLRPFRAVATA